MLRAPQHLGELVVWVLGVIAFSTLIRIGWELGGRVWAMIG